MLISDFPLFVDVRVFLSRALMLMLRGRSSSRKMMRFLSLSLVSCRLIVVLRAAGTDRLNNGVRYLASAEEDVPAIVEPEPEADSNPESIDAEPPINDVETAVSHKIDFSFVANLPRS